MGSPGAQPLVDRRTHPLLIVAGTLLVVLIASFGIYSVGDYDSEDGLPRGSTNLAGASPVGTCGQGTPADATYDVDVAANPDPPRPEGTTFLLTVRHDGKAVSGAKVCFAADMPEMQHPGLTYVTKEGSAGRYEARLQFVMGGTWRAAVIIAEPDTRVVSVPLMIQVAEPGAD